MGDGLMLILMKHSCCGAFITRGPRRGGNYSCTHQGHKPKRVFECTKRAYRPNRANKRIEQKMSKPTCEGEQHGRCLVITRMPLKDIKYVKVANLETLKTMKTSRCTASDVAFTFEDDHDARGGIGGKFSWLPDGTIICVFRAFEATGSDKPLSLILSTTKL
ncbi:hypothetical protein Syun_021752 [Stephania yunnanensis]|uniref:Uncharacterized protein n=1 Tax=Stephania yunnanensis TaxID=152371 RepID=A0AAP0NRD5_9MAGN